LGGLINRREKGLVMLSIADGSFVALAVLPIALVFLLAYGNRARRSTRPSAVRTMRRRRD
jgi:hypothetical protein